MSEAHMLSCTVTAFGFAVLPHSILFYMKIVMQLYNCLQFEVNPT